MFPFVERFPLCSEFLTVSLRGLLAQTDSVAFDNVTHDDHGRSIVDAQSKPIKGKFSRGGPFGALLAISYGDDQLEIIGQPCGNNVVGSGIASRHAEDRALQPSHYQLLLDKLSDASIQKQDPFVWMISSGQSCTTCHTKQEIMARDLRARGLLSPDRFITLYGATFDETLDIAQFYDAQYADAMIFFSRNPEHKGNLIRQEHIRFQSAPFEVQKILENADSPKAVVVREGAVYTVGQDTRTAFDPYATAEVNAVRAACVRNRTESDVFASWSVDGELYTTNAEIGPLLFAEAGWTKIGVVKSVKMPKRLKNKQFETRETPHLGNTDFLHIVAGGYHHPQAAIQVLRDESFRNSAQPQWADMLRINGEQLYNGAAVSPSVEAMRDLTRKRFAAFDLSCCNGLQRPIRPLHSLGAVAGQSHKNYEKLGCGV